MDVICTLEDAKRIRELEQECITQEREKFKYIERAKTERDRALAAERQLAEVRDRYKWISVEERWPETNDEYLVADPDGIQAAHYFSEVQEFHTVRGYGWDAETEVLWAVTHWMPFPAPPERVLSAAGDATVDADQ